MEGSSWGEEDEFYLFQCFKSPGFENFLKARKARVLGIFSGKILISHYYLIGSCSPGRNRKRRELGMTAAVREMLILREVLKKLREALN